jgi:hypothetical protein
MGTDLMIPFHVPTAFKVGDIVIVTADVAVAHAWYGDYGSGAKAHVGLKHKVTAVDWLQGFWCQSDLSGSTYFPSCALELYVQPACTISLPSMDELGRYMA